MPSSFGGSPPAPSMQRSSAARALPLPPRRGRLPIAAPDGTAPPGRPPSPGMTPLPAMHAGAMNGNTSGNTLLFRKVSPRRRWSA
jgi:hypothetical protein